MLVAYQPRSAFSVSADNLADIPCDDTLARQLRLIISTLDQAKADDIQTIHLHDKTTFADAMIVATGMSQRHLDALADKVCETLFACGIRKPHVEGRQHSPWVLIDGGDVVVHVFTAEARSFYDLEKIWRD